MKTSKVRFLILSVLTVLLVGTGCVQQGSVEQRNEIIGETRADGNYFEAQQISDIEDWKDDPSKIVNVYLINPVTGGLLIPPVQCKGVPASSTESLEPNHGVPRGGAGAWLVPLDGVDVLTDELTGRDGTFGEPVAFRQCMSVDGNYYDFPAMGLPYLVSSASYTFPDAVVQRDYETEAKLLLAEQILERGGCIDVQTLTEIPCTSE